MPWLYFGNSRLTNVPKDTSTSYTTTTGEMREVKLPDNSTVKLNTRSQITVTYALHARNVNLDYGELITGEKESRGAWQQGKIIFDRTPLADALAEVDRYTNIEFIVADEKLRGVRVAGDFRTGDVDGLLDMLRKNFRIDSRRDAHGRVVLTTLTAAGS